MSTETKIKKAFEDCHFCEGIKVYRHGRYMGITAMLEYLNEVYGVDINTDSYAYAIFCAMRETSVNKGYKNAN